MDITREMLEHFASLSPIDAAVYHVTKSGALETLFLSENVPSLLSMTREEYLEITRKDAMDLTLPQDRPGLQAATARCVRTGEPFHYYYRVFHRTRGFDWVHVHAHVCGSMEGRPLILANFSNMTMEGGIYQELLDVSDRMALVIDRNSLEVLYANETARENGAPGSENLLNQTCHSLLYGADHPCGDCFLCAGSPKAGDLVEVWFNSSRGRWEEATRRFVTWCGHDAFVMYIKDITEEKKRESELELSRKTLEVIVDNIPVGLGVCTIRDGRISAGTVNQKMTELTGIQTGSLTHDDQKLLTHVHPEDVPAVFQAMSHCGNPGLTQLEYRFRLDGEEQYRWYRMILRSIPRDGGTMVFSCLIDISTERIAGAEALKSRQMYRTAAQVSRLVVWEYDARTRRISMMMDNAYTGETCRRLGIPAVLENGPDTLAAMIAPKDREAFRKMYRRMDGGAQEASCEFEIPTSEGMLCWSTVCSAVRDEKGSLLTICGIGRDITDQRREQEHFRREFQQLLAVNPEAIGSFRHNLTKNWTGDGQGVFSKRFGEEASGTVDRHVAALGALLINREDRWKFLKDFSRENLLRIFGEGQNQKIFEYPMRMPDGSCRWVRGTLNMLRNPDTGDVEAVTYAADVTETRKREEIARRVSEDEFDYVGVIYVDTRQFEFYNKKPEIAFPALHQRVLYEECLRYVCMNFTAAAERKHFLSITSLSTICAALREHGRYETSYIRTEGETSSRRQLRYTWLDEPGGEVLVVRTDVTAAYEQEQRQLLLVQDALRQAEHANAAKSDFLARMSHDLRTPLGGVIGLSYLAMGDTLPPADIKRYLAEIHRSGEYLLGIINDILDMSKIENKKLELHPEPVPFSDFSGTLRDVIDVQCGEKHQTFEIAGPAGNAVRCIRVDKTRFIQIFVNLLTNAVKYTPEGGHIRFTVEQLSRTETVVLVRFTVQDDGTGMSPEFLAHAFEPFERERDDGQIGTGLGLAIVRNLVELMGGTIRIDSAPGKGTAAVVELPLEIAPEPKRESPQREWTSLAGRRFLLCEDNDINAEIAAELLKNVSAASDRAADGEIGLERFITSPPGTYDAILMDVRMPRMDGIAAAAAIRGLDRPDARTVPIIALTANAFEEDRERCLSAGMDAHIAKPIDPEKLYAVIASAIAGPAGEEPT